MSSTKFKSTLKAKRERAEAIFPILLETYPEATCSLNHRAPLQLLIATILAAQCTDERVNIVTKFLFKGRKKPEDFLAMSEKELQTAIHSCGFYRQKAKSIRQTCRALIDRFGGNVPGTMEELLTLQGVGRKTANVILGECFGVQSIIVDTHCRRITNRLGFTKESDPDKIERDLMKVWPPDTWTRFSHCIVFHGRAICNARKPLCSECPIGHLCPSHDTFVSETL